MKDSKPTERPDRSRKPEILARAAEVVMEQGYEPTSMNQIAERAEMTKAGLYYHFKSKQELLHGIIDAALEVLERETRKATEGIADPEERLRRILHAHARIIHEKEGTFTLLVIDEAGRLPEAERNAVRLRKRAYFDEVRGTLQDLQEEGRLRPEIDATLGTFSLLGMVMWITKWFRADGPLTPAQVADQITELALAAVIPDDRRRS